MLVEEEKALALAPGPELAPYCLVKGSWFSFA